MFQFTFKTRDEYIAQAKEWGTVYQATIDQIRIAKADYKKLQRADESIWPAQKAINTGNETLEKLRTARSNSRIEAQRQYLEKQTAKV